jgi:hypothetical protein
MGKGCVRHSHIQKLAQRPPSLFHIEDEQAVSGNRALHVFSTEGWTYHFMRPVFWVMRPNLQDTGLKKRDGFETHVPFFRTHVSYFRATVSKNETPKMAHLDFKRQFCLESKVPNALIST